MKSSKVELSTLAMILMMNTKPFSPRSINTAGIAMVTVPTLPVSWVGPSSGQLNPCRSLAYVSLTVSVEHRGVSS